VNHGPNLQDQTATGRRGTESDRTSTELPRRRPLGGPVEIDRSVREPNVEGGLHTTGRNHISRGYRGDTIDNADEIVGRLSASRSRLHTTVSW